MCEGEVGVGLKHDSKDSKQFVPVKQPASQMALFICWCESLLKCVIILIAKAAREDWKKGMALSPAGFFFNAKVAYELEKKS